jgi:hypothetical protein
MNCRWPLGNGQFLDFDVYARNENWSSVGGLYVFSYQGGNGSWRALYVGQTNNFSVRFPNHERLNEAVRAGATHIHAKVMNSQSDRDLFERALIQYLQPSMNTQLA